jgi:hypothetical protein
MSEYKKKRIMKEFPELGRFARLGGRKLLERVFKEADVTVQVADDNLKRSRIDQWEVPDASLNYSESGGEKFFVAFYSAMVKTLRKPFLNKDPHDTSWLDTVGERFFAPSMPIPKFIVEIKSAYVAFGPVSSNIVIHKVR